MRDIFAVSKFLLLIVIVIFTVAIGACIGMMIGAIAFPLKILDGSITDAPEKIKEIFNPQRDTI